LCPSPSFRSDSLTSGPGGKSTADVTLTSRQKSNRSR
jgi:hypothetical protein